MKGLSTLIFCALLLAGGAWYMLTYVLISDEDKIERVIEQGRRAVEGGSMYSLERILAPNYQHGGMDRATVLRLMRQLSNQLGDVSIQTVSRRIHLEGDLAHADVEYSFSTDLSAAPAVFREALQEQMGVQSIHVRFINDSGRWKVIATDFQ